MKVNTAWRTPLLILGALSLIAALYFGIPGWKAYKKWEKQRHDTVVLTLGSKIRIEAGVITLKWTNMSWELGERFLTWEVKIPSTRKTFSCNWEGGDPIFKEGDFVLLAYYPSSEGESDYGYLIEPPGGQKHRFVLVWVTDKDDIIPWDTYGGSD